MAEPGDIRLKLMARSLREYIELANDLDLRFTAQLLSMAVMEITINMHGISQREVDALCERIENRSAEDGKPALASVSALGFHDRRARTRRS